MNKQLLSFTALLFFLVTNSCQKNVEKEETLQKNVTVASLTTSLSFIEFVKVLDKIQNRIIYSTQTNAFNKYVLNKQIDTFQVTETQMRTEIANEFGYKNYDEYVGVLNLQKIIVNKLKIEFLNINSVSIDSLKLAIKNVHFNLKYTNNEFSRVFVEDNYETSLCQDIFNNCNSQASAVYTFEVLSCFTGAVGLGILSFGGGVLLLKSYVVQLHLII